MAGDSETGVTIIETVPELDAGPIAAQRAFPIDAGGRLRHRVRAGRRARPPSCSRRCCPSRRFDAAARRRASRTRRRSAAEDRELDWSRPPQELLNRIRALSPHIGARGELHGRPVTIWRARVEGGELVPVEVQPDGGGAWTTTRSCAGSAERLAGAPRRVRDDSPRLRGRRLRRPRLSAAAARARPARPRARAAARLRDDPARPHARPRDRAARPPAGREARPARAGRAAARRVPARLLGGRRHAAVNESVELVRAAGLERAVSFANAVMRRLALGLRELVEALPEATRGAGGARGTRIRTGSRSVWWRDLGADGGASR